MRGPSCSESVQCCAARATPWHASSASSGRAAISAPYIAVSNRGVTPTASKRCSRPDSASSQGVETAEQMLDGALRAMKAQQIKEIEHLEHQLSALATVGSTSPYVGLFGTVWGIMHAFVGLGSVQQATLATVAPGIAEALIATAMGLLAAIPAVVAYNRFADQVWRLESRYDAFVEEFSTILQRSVPRGATVEVR